MLGSNRIPEDALGTLLGPQQVCRRPCLWTCRTYHAEKAGPKFWFWGWLHLLVTTCHNESMPLSSLATLGMEEILETMAVNGYPGITRPVPLVSLVAFVSSYPSDETFNRLTFGFTVSL